MPQSWSRDPYHETMPDRGGTHESRLLTANAGNASTHPTGQSDNDEDLRERGQIYGMVGVADRIRDVYKMVARVAPTSSTVLVQGETGTGKELIARAIHSASRRCHHPFVTVDCSALAESLLESELFGHVKGAFTGAVTDKRGFFEAADGGTCFLDEVGEISPCIQAKLLRVLQEREVRRVGGTDSFKVDVRVIAATNKDVAELVAEGKFREDLFYRLSAGAVRAVLAQLPGLDVVRVLRPRRAPSGRSLTPDEATEVYVVRVDPDRAELLKQMTPPQLIVEEDAALDYGTPAGLSRPAPTRLASWSSTGAIENRQMRFRVIGEGDKPLAHCRSQPDRGRLPARGANGQAGGGRAALDRVARQARPLPVRERAEQLLGSISHRTGIVGRRGERRPASRHRGDHRGVPGAIPVRLGPDPDGPGSRSGDARRQRREDATWDATTVLPSMVSTDGIFSPSFSCFGPEIAVCAPGVAIVSTVPGGFEPQSGTSVAARHVTGLAALLLAHHPTFQGPLQARGQQRVAALFSMIRWMSVPYGFGEFRVGAGLPRLHGLEQLLRTKGDRTTVSTGNGQTATPIPAAPSAVSGVPYGQPVGTAVVPMTATLAPPFATPVFGAQEAPSGIGGLDPAHLVPVYVQAPLVAQAWPVEALLESLRRQYLGA